MYSTKCLIFTCQMYLKLPTQPSLHKYSESNYHLLEKHSEWYTVCATCMATKSLKLLRGEIILSKG